MALTKISTGGVKDDAVTAGKIPANAVGSSEIADDAVGTAQIADDGVVQAAIADEAVDEARLQVSNAGSNGQFLSKQSGNTGGLTWADAGGGIATEYDCWDGGNGTGASNSVDWSYTVIGLTNADDGYFNWARIGSLTPVGNGMTESAGVWTFPSTGMWKIQLHINMRFNSSGDATVQVRPEFSTDSGSSYTNKPPFEWRNTASASAYSLETMLYFQNITNATNDRLRFSMWNTNTKLVSLQEITKIEFTKIA